MERGLSMTRGPLYGGGGTFSSRIMVVESQAVLRQLRTVRDPMNQCRSADGTGSSAKLSHGRP